MLPILLPIAWLVVMALFMAVCRMAARGDGQLPTDVARPTRRIDAGLVVWDEGQAPTRPHARRSHRAHSRRNARGVRTHGVR
jgi:hypothetical protein